MGPQLANRHEVNINFTKPHLPQVVMTYHDHGHPIKTNTYKPSYRGQILMDLNKIVRIGSQQENRHEVNLNLIPLHKWSWPIMTIATQLKQIPPNLIQLILLN